MGYVATGMSNVFTCQLLDCTRRRRLARRTQIALFHIFQKMGRKASLYDVQRARIATLHEEEHSEREIAVKMACSKTAVHTTINNFELYCNYSDKKRVVGREKLHVEMTT